MASNITETIDGVTYPSLSALARAYNIKVPTIARRYRLGLRGHDLVRELDERKAGRVVTVHGTTYQTLADVARAYGMLQSTVANRYARGFRGDDLVTDNLRGLELTVDGQSFNTFKDMARAFNVSVSRVTTRYRRGLRGRDLVADHISHSNSPEPFVVNGVEYLTLADLARDYGVTRQLVHSRYKAGERGADLVRGRERIAGTK